MTDETDRQNEQIDLLLERNVSEIIQKDQLKALLSGSRKLKVYLGVDPSSPDIHLGHAVVLWKLRQFQDLGHEVILLIGDFTAQIGDPTGHSKERPPLSHEEVLENAASYKDQAAKVVRFSGENPAQLLFNSAWLEKLTLKDVIKLAGYFTVQQLLERDMFQERLKNSQPIGLHEFLYPLVVGYDSVHMDVDVEVGGNDQLFNIKAGRTLMEKIKNKKKVVLTCELLTGSDGSKMSKSKGNIIPITASPEEMFGQLMAISDTLISHYAELCSEMTDVELAQVEKRLASKENPRDIKMDVAERVVARYSSKEQASSAREKFKFMFSKAENYQGVPQVDAFFPAPTASMILLDLVSSMAAKSKSEARRLIEGGAVDIDGVSQTNPMLQLDLTKSMVVKIGKHHFMRVQYLNTPNQ